MFDLDSPWTRKKKEMYKILLLVTAASPYHSTFDEQTGKEKFKFVRVPSRFGAVSIVKCLLVPSDLDLEHHLQLTKNKLFPRYQTIGTAQGPGNQNARLYASILEDYTLPR
jgi:hypothetical protein